MKKAVWGAIVIMGIVVGIQLVPYGRHHTNPAVRAEPVWDRPQTGELARRACFDCHSNETRWPWYAHVAPVSWYLYHDVVEGRQELNFSEWDRAQKEAKDVGKATRQGDMPPRLYLLAHPEATLNESDRDTLVAGLEATLKRNRPGDSAEEHEEERD